MTMQVSKPSLRPHCERTTVSFWTNSKRYEREIVKTPQGQIESLFLPDQTCGVRRQEEFWIWVNFPSSLHLAPASRILPDPDGGQRDSAGGRPGRPLFTRDHRGHTVRLLAEKSGRHSGRAGK